MCPTRKTQKWRPSREQRGAADALEYAGETDLEKNPEASGKTSIKAGSGCADRRAAIVQ
jgi:hypothetical protein